MQICWPIVAFVWKFKVFLSGSVDPGSTRVCGCAKCVLLLLVSRSMALLGKYLRCHLVATTAFDSKRFLLRAKTLIDASCLEALYN